MEFVETAVEVSYSAHTNRPICMRTFMNDHNIRYSVQILFGQDTWAGTEDDYRSTHHRNSRCFC